MDHSTGTYCSFCNKKFANHKLKNRHIKRVHKLNVPLSRKSNILCPLCEEQKDEINTYENLREHLEGNHEITIKNVNFEFSDAQEYEMWRNTENIETMYACDRNNQYIDHKQVHYVCNRSNTRRYQAKRCKRTEKAGGTIKIQGVCPSKLIVKIYNTGRTIVTFWKTHAGHDEKELRSKHLSITEKNLVVEKLKCGVPKARIVEDARKLETSELQRINLLSSNDVNYLAKKYNIKKKRDNNDVVAVVLQVEKGNANDNSSEAGPSSQIRTQHIEKISQSIKKEMTNQEFDQAGDDPNKRINLQREELHKWIDNLNKEAFERFMRNIEGAKEQEDKIALDKIADKETKITEIKIEEQLLDYEQPIQCELLDVRKME